MTIVSRNDLDAAAAIMAAHMPPTPQIAWPLLAARTGAKVWVKHENHTPIGAFKVRGGLVYMTRLRVSRPDVRRVVTATRGNHGQSVALAAAKVGVRATVVVPHGNNPEKNAAMRAFGAELVEHGDDFHDALDHARALGAERGLHMMPSFHPDLVAGVGTYAMELFAAAPDLETVYVPIGQGSGICGVMAARDALGLRCDVVGVVAAGAPCYALSFAAGRAVATARADTLADGVACRKPDDAALAAILAGVARVVEVDDDAILAAMRHYFTDTHNLAEGAGAAPLAALLAERERNSGRRVGLILSGGNVDRALMRRALEGDEA